jgi:hypothetical protein
LPRLHYPNKPTHGTWALWVCVAAIGLLYVLLRIHSLAIPLDRDEGIFGYAGQRILEGGKPYRDVLDHKPPGIFYIYALALKFFPATPVGVHLFLLLYNLLTLAAVALLLHIRFRSRQAWLAGAFCYALFSASPAIQGFTASTEMLMLLPITICLLLAVAAKRTGHPLLLFLSGAAGAAAFWIKQTAGTSILFVAIYLIAGKWLDDEAHEQRPNRLRDLLLWSGGAAAVSAMVAGYFYLTGLFQPFVYWSFVHNVLYTEQIPVSETAAAIVRSFKEILRGDFVVLGLGIGTAVYMLRERKSDALFVLGFLLFSFVGTLPGFAFPHYFAQIAPAVAVASGWALSLAAQKMKWSSIPVIVAIVALFATPLYAHWDYFVALDHDDISRRNFVGINPFPESAELSAFLAARTSEADHIFIFGSEPQILFEAHRKSATPMVMIYPLTREYSRYLEFQDQVWRDIDQAHPAYILFVNLAASIASDGKAKLQIMDRLVPLIRGEYQMVGIMPVGKSGTKLVLLDDLVGQVPQDLVRNPTNIFIYRRVHPE